MVLLTAGGGRAERNVMDSGGDEVGVSEEPSLQSRPRQGCAEGLDHTDSAAGEGDRPSAAN